MWSVVGWCVVIELRDVCCLVCVLRMLLFNFIWRRGGLCVQCGCVFSVACECMCVLRFPIVRARGESLC